VRHRLLAFAELAPLLASLLPTALAASELVDRATQCGLSG
jgi:hypothetical protein